MRSELQQPEITALAAAMHSASDSAKPSCAGQIAKIAASSTAPNVCPVSRADPSMPLAAPLRCNGALVTMV